MAKKTAGYVCENCNYRSLKWLGQCPNCKEWDTMVEDQVRQLEDSAQRLVVVDNSKRFKLSEINTTKLERIDTKSNELNNVLGGGFLRDQAILLAGEPGVGKSTLALQLAINMSGTNNVLYISAEESVSQVSQRAQRINPEISSGGGLKSDLTLLNSGNLASIIGNIIEVKPDIVVIDSIQTIYDENVSGIAGNAAQVRSCTAQLISLAKQLGFLLIIIGHITKEGTIAGPKALEHLVDTVLHFEGDNLMDYRILRSVKNRFGQVGEIGLFVMTEEGLQDIGPDTNIFIDAEEKENIGIARTVVMDGQRPLLVEVQALASSTVFNYPKRVAEGISTNRIHTICAIVSKYSEANLSDSDVYIKVTGGYRVKDSAADFAIAKALISSATKRPLQTDTVYLGELNLSGKILPATMLDRRLKEASRFGIKNAAVASTSKTKATKINLLMSTKL